MSKSFDPGASYVPTGLRKAVQEAIQLGWTAKKQGRGGWSLRSPKGTQKFYVPITAKDPDTLASKLRSMMNKAYLGEDSAFEPGISQIPGQVDYIHGIQDRVLNIGTSIVQGPSPYLSCPDCDGEWLEIEGFMAHQKACQERTAAALAAAQDAEAPQEGDASGEALEEASVEVPADHAEAVQEGTITAKEETPVEFATVDRPEPTRRGGYKWKNVRTPLHRMIYEAVHNNRRRANETDSTWSLRLAEYVEEKGLLDALLSDEPEEAVTAISTLESIRKLLGPDESADLKAALAKAEEEIESKNNEVKRLRETFATMSDLARQEAQ